MPDVIVTLPKSFGLQRWLEEGDPAGEPWSGTFYYYWLGIHAPNIKPGERVYVCYKGRLIGYAPLIRVHQNTWGRCALLRGGDAVAVTIDQPIPGFRGYRYRFWNREDEYPFEDWKSL